MVPFLILISMLLFFSFLLAGSTWSSWVCEALDEPAMGFWFASISSLSLFLFLFFFFFFLSLSLSLPLSPFLSRCLSLMNSNHILYESNYRAATCWSPSSFSFCSDFFFFFFCSFCLVVSRTVEGRTKKGTGTKNDFFFKFFLANGVFLNDRKRIVP